MKNFRKSALFVIVSLALSACYKHLPEEVESVTDGRAKVTMTFSLETSDMNAPATDEPGVAEAQACEAEQSFRVEMNEKQTSPELNSILLPRKICWRDSGYCSSTIRTRS